RIASSTLSKGIAPPLSRRGVACAAPLQVVNHETTEHVALDVHPISGSQVGQVRMFERERDQGNLYLVPGRQPVDGQTPAGHRYRSVEHRYLTDFRWHR